MKKESSLNMAVYSIPSGTRLPPLLLSAGQSKEDCGRNAMRLKSLWTALLLCTSLIAQGDEVIDRISGYDGVTFNGPTHQATSPSMAYSPSTGLHCDGDDQYVHVPTNSMPSTGSVSVAVWFKLDDTFTADNADTMTLFRYGTDESDNDVHLVLKGSSDYERGTVGSLTFKQWRPSYGDWEWISSGNTVWTNTETYFATVTYDEATYGMALYANGVLIGTWNLGETRGSTYSANFCIAAHTSLVRFFKGTLWDMTTYNCALTSNQVYNMYVGNGTNNPTAISEWRMNDSTAVKGPVITVD